MKISTPDSSLSDIWIPFHCSIYRAYEYELCTLDNKQCRRTTEDQSRVVD